MDADPYEARSNWVLGISQLYFPFLRADNFPNLFKLSLHKVVCLTKSRKKQNHVRNFLILLYHCKLYLPTRTACIFFNLEKTKYNNIVRVELQTLFDQHVDSAFSLEHRFENEMAQFPCSYMVVDTTEILIEAYQKKSFSGKKKNFTVKYQLLVGALSGEILHIYGPELGSVHDAKIWENSGMGYWLLQNQEYCLGDKGYVGCIRVIHPSKKGRNPLTQEKIP
jgi:hypothetical protein